MIDGSLLGATAAALGEAVFIELIVSHALSERYEHLAAAARAKGNSTSPLSLMIKTHHAARGFQRGCAAIISTASARRSTCELAHEMPRAATDCGGQMKSGDCAGSLQ